jgi:hypothetical protein
MSQAFAKEYDEQWLHEIPPTMSALIQYLTKGNNGVRVYEKKRVVNPAIGKDVHGMSNGFWYAIKDHKWYMVDEDVQQ